MASVVSFIWLICLSTCYADLILVNKPNNNFLPRTLPTLNVDLVDKNNDFFTTPTAWNMKTLFTTLPWKETPPSFSTYKNPNHAHPLALSRNEIQCRSEMTKFAFDSGLCGYKTSSLYLEKSTPAYTCKSRCGDKRTSSTDCGCDEKCVMFNDCCKDMKLLCPEIIAKAANKTFGAYGATCVGENSLAVNECHGKKKNLKDKYSEFLKSLNTPDTPRSLLQTALDKSLTIDIFSNRHSSYTVVDASSETLYTNIKTFKTCSDSVEVPLFTSQITTLHCKSKNKANENLPSLLDVLGLCRKVSWKDAATFKHRPCHVQRVLSCHCENGEIETDFLHNVCLGDDKSVSDTHRIPYDSRVLRSIRYPDNKECLISPETDEDMPVKAPKFELVVNVTTALELTQEFVTTENETQKLKSSSFNFLVDLGSWTAERRLRCFYWNSPLRMCQLEACAEGAFLVEATGNSELWFSGRRACQYPKLAVVKWQQEEDSMSSCECLRILAAFSALHQWRVSLKSKVTICFYASRNEELPIPKPMHCMSEALVFRYPDSVTLVCNQRGLMKENAQSWYHKFPASQL